MKTQVLSAQQAVCFSDWRLETCPTVSTSAPVLHPGATTNYSYSQLQGEGWRGLVKTSSWCADTWRLPVSFWCLSPLSHLRPLLLPRCVSCSCDCCPALMCFTCVSLSPSLFSLCALLSLCLLVTCSRSAICSLVSLRSKQVPLCLNLEACQWSQSSHVQIIFPVVASGAVMFPAPWCVCDRLMNREEAL